MSNPETATVRVLMKRCQDEISKFDDMTARNKEFDDCIKQLMTVIQSHVDIMYETLNYDDELVNE